MKYCLSVLFFLVLLLLACEDQKVQQMVRENRGDTDSSAVILKFSMTINRHAYHYTTYGQPPQIAVWIEKKEQNDMRTVWVTRCAGTNQWRGKIDCPVALPYWDYRRKEASEQKVDAKSGATPQSGVVSFSTVVPAQTHWRYLIEVNAAGDYNEFFPYWSKEGMPDTEGNGQPSVIYEGHIFAEPGEADTPQLIGRSEQRRATGRIISDIDGLQEALQLIENVQVTCSMAEQS